MTALEPVTNHCTPNKNNQTTNIVNNRLDEQDQQLLVPNNDTQSPLITNSTNTRIDLFRKYKQQIAAVVAINTRNDPVVNCNPHTTSFDDLKTYSTPPQSPPLSFSSSSSSLTSTFHLSSPLIKLNTQSCLMINEEEGQHSSVTTISDSTSCTNETKKIRINSLHEKINENNELLRATLKASHERFRSIQAKYFHTHVARQLNKILELKEKQKQIENENENDKQTVNQIETATVPNSSIHSTLIDDTSVDLLTSILKSNLNKNNSSNTNNTNQNSNSNSNVDVAVKSLLDDLQYEILKQAEENKSLKKSGDEEVDSSSATDNEHEDDCENMSDDDYLEEDDDNVFDDVDVAVRKLKNVNKKHKISTESTETVNTTTSALIRASFNQTLVNNNNNNNNNQLTKSNVDEEKKLIDSSNLFWNMTKAQLGSQWECVQTKLKYMKLKAKQYNDYSIKSNRFIASTNVNNVNNLKISNNQKNANKSSSAFPNPESVNLLTPVKPIEVNPASVAQDEAAQIAALSSSLQESVAAVVNTTSPTPTGINTSFNIKKENQQEIEEEREELTASRCLPFKNNFKSKSHARLFNLNRNDLIKLDDDVIRSLYFTLQYFNNTYFKSICTCSQLQSKSLNEKKRKILNRTNEQRQQYSLSDLLSLKKTCIFCHLLKEYEKNRTLEINTNSKCLEKKLKKEEEEEIEEDNKNDEQEKQNEEETTDQLADPESVKSDHSYCKQAYTLNGNGKQRTSSSRIKLSRQVSNEQNDFLERMVNERLSRLFESNAKSKNIFEKNTINKDEDDQFIDAGLDLPPGDLQNLPDLSYEE